MTESKMTPQALAESIMNAQLARHHDELVSTIWELDSAFSNKGRSGGGDWYAERNRVGKDNLRKREEAISAAWRLVLGGQSVRSAEELRPEAAKHAKDRFFAEARDVAEIAVPKAGTRFPAGDPKVLADAAEQIAEELFAILSLPATPPKSMVQSPRELEPSLELFRQDHPGPESCGFVMMRFDQSRLHSEIISSIRDCLDARSLKALRADDKSYSDDLLPNIRTYMHGCAFGIAVFERLTADEFNPNVSLEVGYMMALGKPVLLLKDSTLHTLPADLVGRLYSTFDPQSPATTIPPILSRWLSEKNLGMP